jgi:hypothetical protein
MDGELAYWASLSGLSPAEAYSVADHKRAAGVEQEPKFEYFAPLSGLTPVEGYSLADHMAALYAGGAAAFTPESIEGLSGWWDASDASTITLGTGTKITEWRDKSGFDRHLAQATETKQPTLEASVSNDLPGVKFDGANAQILANSYPYTEQPSSVWAVVRSDAVSTGGTEVFVGHQAMSLRVSGGSNLYGMDASATLLSDVSDTNGTFHFVAGVFKNDLTSILYVDGVSFIGNAGTSAPASPMRFALGSNAVASLTGEEHSRHTVMESGMYDGFLTVAEIDDLYAYVQDKWAI